MLVIILQVCSLGKDVASLLYEAADLTVLERKGGSLMSLRSAVRAWNAFAFEVLIIQWKRHFLPWKGGTWRPLVRSSRTWDPH